MTELGSSQLDGKLTSGIFLRNRKSRQMGIITKYSTDERIWKPICTAFLVSQNVVASAGSCIKKIVKKSGKYKDFEVQLGSAQNKVKELERYFIEEVFHYNDFNNLQTEDSPNLDIGLIKVILFSNLYFIYQINQ